MADVATEQAAAVRRIVESLAPRKIVVAGPGAGKTFVFRSLLERLPVGRKAQRLAFTFINELRDSLLDDLGQLADVFTFHGYCHRLLRERAHLRGNLSAQFIYFPKLVLVVKRDWSALRGGQAPAIVPDFRNVTASDAVAFFIARSGYYDALGFDDSVYRVHAALSGGAPAPMYDLLIVDEFQDFNRAEVEVIGRLAVVSPTVLAGDDDQALYGQLRGADEAYIRLFHASGEYAAFPLPFCMRCTDVIVRAANDIVAKATQAGLLKGRIDKPFKPFPPLKGADSRRYPRLRVVRTSVQNSKFNYFAKYIEEQVAAIPMEDVEESHEKNFPTVLVIGKAPYLSEVQRYLVEAGHQVEVRGTKKGSLDTLTREDALRVLRRHPNSSLGWRIAVELDHPDTLDELLKATQNGDAFHAALPADYVDQIREEAQQWQEPEAQPLPARDPARPLIKVTTFQGSKGLSAHHVFVIGLHNKELPKKATAPTDFEVRQFLVALTRTRKQCHLLYATRRDQKGTKTRSLFIGWIAPRRVAFLGINKDYWKR